MKKAEFWELVDASRAMAARRVQVPEVDLGDKERRHRLRLQDDLLAELVEHRVFPSDAMDFYRLLLAVHAEAHRYDVWAAFDFAAGGVDEEDFLYARQWLVLQGRAAYERVLADPDNLADLDFYGRLDFDAVCGIGEHIGPVVAELMHVFEEFDEDDFGATEAAVAEYAEQLPEPVCYEVPSGVPLPRDIGVLRRRFPKIAARYVPPYTIELVPPSSPSRARLLESLDSLNAMAGKPDDPSRPVSWVRNVVGS